MYYGNICRDPAKNVARASAVRETRLNVTDATTNACCTTRDDGRSRAHSTVAHLERGRRLLRVCWRATTESCCCCSVNGGGGGEWQIAINHYRRRRRRRYDAQSAGIQ